MRYITVLKGAQPAGPPPEGLMPAIMGLGAEATASGALLDMDGPFAEAKEYISYAVYEVRSKEEAVEWASRFMQLHSDLWPGWQGECDVIKIMGPEDFGPPQ